MQQINQLQKINLKNIEEQVYEETPKQLFKQGVFIDISKDDINLVKKNLLKNYVHGFLQYLKNQKSEIEKYIKNHLRPSQKINPFLKAQKIINFYTKKKFHISNRLDLKLLFFFDIKKKILSNPELAKGIKLLSTFQQQNHSQKNRQKNQNDQLTQNLQIQNIQNPQNSPLESPKQQGQLNNYSEIPMTNKEQYQDYMKKFPISNILKKKGFSLISTVEENYKNQQFPGSTYEFEIQNEHITPNITSEQKKQLQKQLPQFNEEIYDQVQACERKILRVFMYRFLRKELFQYTFSSKIEKQMIFFLMRYYFMEVLFN
ncbi:hypothetical protein PPERSA_01932 [Pseudocohnilembus persalinus]|uniref:Uncharacterized protein n=1 Tax=Pseudocohnilembus persalinus TaxID=266149 RepID=A0A0V0R493_PSEPJ|nr:hypothetical protein PPERSA_01932 [Pseudocohnilembus persalinus]|eukprot:KRX09045.1 hypothetical protein PPERSA_01932 [Pseudocohnilembus persalinus]